MIQGHLVIMMGCHISMTYFLCIRWSVLCDQDRVVISVQSADLNSALATDTS